MILRNWEGAMNSYLESPEKSLELLVKLLNNKQEGEYSKATDLLADLHKLTKDEIFPHLNQEAPAKSSIFIDDFRRELIGLKLLSQTRIMKRSISSV